jgi:hypothetical protein
MEKCPWRVEHPAPLVCGRCRGEQRRFSTAARLPRTLARSRASEPHLERVPILGHPIDVEQTVPHVA